MAKPSSVANWDTNATNQSTPTAGHQSDGFAINEVPTSTELNGELNILGQWIAYLNAGAMDGPFTFNNTVIVTGLITAQAGVTAAANQHVTLSGSGLYKHGTRTVTLHWSAGQAYGRSATIVPNTATDLFQATQATGPAWIIPIHLEAGKRIINIRAHLTDFNALPAVAVTLLEQTTFGAASSIASANSAANGTAQTVTLSAINHTLVSGFPYFVTIQGTQTNPTSIQWVEIDFDQP